MRQPVTMRQAGQRSWLTLAFVVLGVLALSLSNVEPASARTAATSLSAGAGDTHANGILQETARQVSAKGRWWRDRDERYLGGRALSARQKGASLAVTFTGTGLRIVGPRSLTRGRARIYVDGRHVATVERPRRHVPRPSEPVRRDLGVGEAPHGQDRRRRNGWPPCVHGRRLRRPRPRPVGVRSGAHDRAAVPGARDEGYLPGPCLRRWHWRHRRVDPSQQLDQQRP